MELISKLEVERETVSKFIEDNMREHEFLTKWLGDIDAKIAQEVRRKELPETRDKVVDVAPEG
jgi:hypothetical protein